MIRSLTTAATLAIAMMCASSAAFAWQYSNRPDKFTGKKTQVAKSVSKNSLRLGFPYNGPNKGYLYVREHPTYGTDVIFGVDRGQFNCELETCPISIRFDEEEPMHVDMLLPEDRSSDTLFFPNPPEIIEKLKKHRRTMIRVTFFSQGSHVLEFTNTPPLKWTTGDSATTSKSGE